MSWIIANEFNWIECLCVCRLLSFQQKWYSFTVQKLINMYTYHRITIIIITFSKHLINFCDNIKVKKKKMKTWNEHTACTCEYSDGASLNCINSLVKSFYTFSSTSQHEMMIQRNESKLQELLVACVRSFIDYSNQFEYLHLIKPIETILTD